METKRLIPLVVLLLLLVVLVILYFTGGEEKRLEPDPSSTVTETEEGVIEERPTKTIVLYFLSDIGNMAVYSSMRNPDIIPSPDFIKQLIPRKDLSLIPDEEFQHMKLQWSEIQLYSLLHGFIFFKVKFYSTKVKDV